MIDISKHRPTLRNAAAASLAGALAFGLAGCKSKDQTAANGDPADANMAQPYTGGDANGYTGDTGQTQVAGQSQAYTPQSSGENYQTQPAAPIIRHRSTQSSAQGDPQYYPVPQSGSNAGASYNGSQQAYDQGYQQGYDQNGYNDQSAYNQGYGDAEYAGEQALAEADQPPPPLPEYDQPPAPEDDYQWTPGYWNYASAGYYWVPGAWVAPPFIGALWTPPYWGYSGSHYICHRGYWGPHVGYYGGVNYGFGYVGTGYYGGYWQNRNFYYNRAVTNVNITNIHNVYNRTVIINNVTYGPRTNNFVSYNGGRGGLNVQPRPQELAAMREAHFAPVAAQVQNRQLAENNRAQFFAANRGRPAQAFDTRAIGNVRTIAAAPAEQPFNHPAVFARPNANSTPNPLIRNTVPNQPTFNNNRPGQPNQPTFNNNRPGQPNQPALNNNRPGQPNQPAFNNNRPGQPNQPAFNNRPGQPNQPAFNNNRPGQPNNNARPGFENRPNTPAQPNRTPEPAGRPNEPNRPGAPNQPAFNNRPVEPARPAPNQPGINANRGTVFNPSRPNVEVQRPTQPQPQNRPNVNEPRPTQPQNQPRPAFNEQRPAQPQPRPNFEQPRPQPQAEPRPQQPMQQPRAPEVHTQPSAPRPSAPAPAPHPAAAPHAGGGGNAEHAHNH